MDDTKSTTIYSRYSVTLATTTTEKMEMRRQTQTDRSSERSSADHLECFESNNYSIMHMPKEDTMDKASLKLQLSDNEVSDGEVTKSSKSSYLLEQHILAEGCSRQLTSAPKRQEVTSRDGNSYMGTQRCSCWTGDCWIGTR